MRKSIMEEFEQRRIDPQEPHTRHFCKEIALLRKKNPAEGDSRGIPS